MSDALASAAELDIIIPVYNEGENILATLDSLRASVRTSHRVLICHDRDDDDTLTALRAAGRLDSVVLVKNQGVGAHGAVTTGFRESSAPYVLVFPADDDYNAPILDRMVAEARAGADVVCASRFMAGGQMRDCPLLKDILVRSANFVIRSVASFPTHDATNGFRLFSRRVLHEFPIESTRGFTYSIELLAKAHRAGMKIAEVPASWWERKAGASRFKVLGWAADYLRWVLYIFSSALFPRGRNTETGNRPLLGPLAAFGWLAFSFAFWGFGPFTNYSATGFLDPWIPTGYFLNFDDMVSRFGFPYYVSRLPYTLVGLAFYEVFQPFVANYLLNVLYLWLACVGIYFATARPLGVLAAGVSTLAFAASTYTASAMSWDYPDGPGIAYFALGLWFALSPPRKLPAALSLTLVGVMWALAGATNLIAGLLILPACLAIVAMGPLSNIPLQMWRAAWIGAGAVLCVALFAIPSELIFDDPWFIGPQILQFIYSTQTPDLLANMWGTGYEWIATAYRLIGILGVIVAFLLLAPFATRAMPENAPLVRGISVFVLGAVGLFAFTEFVLEAVVLRVPYTSSYLVVPAYLGVAVALAFLFGRLAPQLRVVVAAACAVSAIAAPYLLDEIAGWTQTHLKMAAIVFVATPIIAAVAALLFARVPNVFAIAAAAAMVATPAVAFTADPAIRYALISHRSTFAAAVDVSAILRSGPIDGRPIRFWFDNDEEHSQVFHSLASLYLWGWRDLTAEVPELSDEDLRATLPDTMTLIHLTEDPERIAARTALLEQRGFQLGPAEDIVVRTAPDLTFHLILQDIQSAPPAPAAPNG